MKRFIVIAILATVLAALLASTALAAGPVIGRWTQQGTTTPTTPGAEGCPMGAGMMAGGKMAGHPEEVATLLGMTDAQIQAERQAGKSLAQIAAAKGVSEDKLTETILNAKKTAMQAAVTAGKMTQAQVDVMVQNMQTMVKTMVERTTTGPMMGGQGTPGSGMRGGMGGRGMRGQGNTGGINF